MLKKTIKKGIRTDYWRYMSWQRSHFGFFPAIIAFSKLYFSGGIGEANAPLLHDSICIRPGTTDQDVFHQIFFSKEYAADLGTPDFIVDAGAHIGLSALFFANQYPRAKVIAIEPEPGNFKLLCRNTRRYSAIFPLQAGLWNKEGHLRITDSSAESWAFRVSEAAEDTGIPAISIDHIIEKYGITSIDVLKIDIEGAEVEVFSGCPKWLGCVKNLIIELHDRFRPGCAAALENALRDYSCRFSTSGENRIYSNLRHKEAVS